MTRDTVQLFVNDSIVETKEGVVRTLHPGRKLSHPILEPERPWEGERIYVYGTIHYDPNAQLFHMWYLSSLRRGHSHSIPGLRRSASDLVLYATSQDGIYWERPSLGRYEFDGSTDNNIVFDVHSPSVIVDDAESDPSKRYKMAGVGRTERHGYWAAHSADGLHWKDYPINPIFPFSDTITTARSPASGDYLVFHKRPALVRGHKRRSVWLSTSPDFQTWSEAKLILAADEKDDSWVQRPEQRTEFYVMSGFPYGGQFLGLLSVFRLQVVHESTGPNQSSHDGPIDIQLTHSQDGLDWERFEDRSPIIAVGEPGSFDGGCLLGVSNPPAVVDDEVHVYYTAITTTHGGPMPPKRCSIGRASWRLDGFVSLDAGPAGGMVETVPLAVSGDRLEVNADASRGSLGVEILSAAGDPLPGYARQDCVAFHSDQVRHAVRWHSTDRLPTGQPVRVRFYLKDAKLYSFCAQA